jgi:hypothetical protein
MTASAGVILWLVGLYAAAGLFIALAFVAIGAPRLIGPAAGHVPVSLGARILLIPGAVILWPLVLWRWLGEPL